MTPGPGRGVKKLSMWLTPSGEKFAEILGGEHQPLLECDTSRQRTGYPGRPLHQ